LAGSTRARTLTHSRAPEHGDGDALGIDLDLDLGPDSDSEIGSESICGSGLWGLFGGHPLGDRLSDITTGATGNWLSPLEMPANGNTEERGKPNSVMWAGPADADGIRHFPGLEMPAGGGVGDWQ
jgi:hypothetical protein